MDRIEHERLRPVYKDPRVHFALNCAAIGCPPLRSQAYTAARLDAQLDAATRDALQDARYVRVRGDALEVSAIMDWYGEDFVDPDDELASDHVAGFVARYAPPRVQAFIREKGGEPEVKFMDYDWNLNDAE